MAHPTQKIEMDVQVDSKANDSFTEVKLTRTQNRWSAELTGQLSNRTV